MGYLPTIEFATALEEAHKPAEVVIYPLEEHVFQLPSNRVASAQRHLDWFRFWLQGYEDPGEEKAEQYRRWESLCDLQVSQNPNQPSFCVRTKTH